MIEIIPYIILAIEDDGDREFMAWLYIQYQSLLYSEIIRIVQSSTDAEDVLHTVIEKLIDKVGLLRKLDRRGLVNYIITAAKNTAYNYCRDKKKELDFDFEQDVIVDNYDSLEDDIIKRENLFCLDQVWNSLDSKTQYLLSAKCIFYTARANRLQTTCPVTASQFPVCWADIPVPMSTKSEEMPMS